MMTFNILIAVAAIMTASTSNEEASTVGKTSHNGTMRINTATMKLCEQYHFEIPRFSRGKQSEISGADVCGKFFITINADTSDETRVALVGAVIFDPPIGKAN